MPGTPPHLNVVQNGPASGPPVLFANGLGTTLHLWDAVLPHLPPSLRMIRYDMRGHGQSDTPPGPYSMGALIHDAERVLDDLNVRDAVIIGLSLGGLVAQGLATKRLDLIRAMVLSNTAARIGTPQVWAARIAATRSNGLPATAEAAMLRWFGPAFRTTPAAQALRAMVAAQNPEGYLAAAHALAHADLTETTARLTLPTLLIAGSHDGSTPPDLMRDTAALIKGARFHLMRQSGHLPPIDAPKAYAALLTDFLRDIGHV